MFNINKSYRQKRNTFLGMLLLSHVVSDAQSTFNKIYEHGYHTVYADVWEWNTQFFTCGIMQDSTGEEYSLVLAKHDQQGNVVFTKLYHSPDTIWLTNSDTNLILDSTFLIAVHGYNNYTETCTLLWFDEYGDSIATKNYISPYYNLEIEANDYISVRDIDRSGGIIYTTCQIFNDDATGNDFVVTQLDSGGNFMWNYIIQDSFGQYCQNIEAVEDGVIVATNSMTGPGAQKFFKLDINGNYVNSWDFSCDETSELSGYPKEFVMENDGIVFCTEYSNDWFQWSLPAIIKTDYSGNIIWNLFLAGSEANNGWQPCEHLVKATDGGYLAAAWQYEENPDNPELNGMDNWNAWLIKISDSGVLEWERFFNFIESVEDKHRVYDLKATSDGGYIFCGDAVDQDVELNGEVIQKGWLVKVDGCGCLVPGCDTDCVVGIEKLVDSRNERFIVGPNPATQFLNIHLLESDNIHPGTYHFQLRDIQGKIMEEFIPKADNTTYMLDIEDYQFGVYVISLLQDGVVVQSKKVVIE